MSEHSIDPWDPQALQARIEDTTARRRYEAGSPDANEVALYRQLLFSNTAFRTGELPRTLILGMTPELRAMVLDTGGSTVAVDRNPASIDLYLDWIPEQLRAREQIVQADWLEIPDRLDTPVDAVLGDGVFGNVLTQDDHLKLLRSLVQVLRAPGPVILRQALIPAGFDTRAHTAEALLQQYRAGTLNDAEFGFAMRLWGSFDLAYDKASGMLDNRIVFERYQDWHDTGKLSAEELAHIRRYFFAGRNMLLPQSAWENLLREAGYEFAQKPLTGRAWYTYYPLYVAMPRKPKYRYPTPQEKLRTHASLRRDVHIALLEVSDTFPRFGALMAYWINERSRHCSASVNERIDEADIVWTYTQDPINEGQRHRLMQLAGRARKDARILNHPERYNAYHEPGTFEKLAAAGVNVPRNSFDDSDIGKVEVVYKRCGEQMSDKEKALYTGPRDGYAAFEYLDSRGTQGLYRRFRAFYIAGAVRPSKLMRCSHWNVCLKHKPTLDVSFTMPQKEQEQLRLIAKTLGIDFFAVDYLRRSGDDEPFFLDINIYPRIASTFKTGPQFGLEGYWHTFDTRRRLGVPEPGGREFVEVFDEAMRRFARGPSQAAD